MALGLLISRFQVNDQPKPTATALGRTRSPTAHWNVIPGSRFVLMKRFRALNPISGSSLTGALLFLGALVFYYFSVLSIDYRHSSLLNLGPYPDATEYFAQAKAMESGHRPGIQIGFERLPSAFPPGYPALMLPWLKLLPPGDDVLAPFRTNQTVGFLMLLTVFAFYLYLAMPLAGGIASLLLATLPGFFTFCRSSLSDPSAWFLYALAFMFAYLGVKEQRRWKVYLSAVFLGLSLNIRLQSVFFLPLLSAMMFFPFKGNGWRWFLHCAALPFVLLLAATPFFIVNTIEMHSPLKIGGGFWYPPRQLFALAYIPTKNLAMFWRELTLRQEGFFAAHIFGTGTVFVAAFVVLLLLGLLFVRLDRAFICLFLASAGFFAATVSYQYPDGRYYLQLLILLIPLAVLPLVWAFRNVQQKKRPLASVGLFVLFSLACLGYPSRTGYQAKDSNSAQALDAVRFHSWSSGSLWLMTERNFVAGFAQKPGVVLSDIDPVYLNALLPDTFTAAPIDQKHKRRWSPSWHYASAEAEAVVKTGLSRRLPIYALFLSAREIPQAMPRLPKIEGYQWVRIRPTHGEIVLTLTSLHRENVGVAVEGSEIAEHILLETCLVAWHGRIWL